MDYPYIPTDHNTFVQDGIPEEYQVSNVEMELAWQFIANTNVSVFLTGKAGTGKTTFLKRLRQETPKRMVVLAPTGVAAINAEGQTIHSFFQLPFGPFNPDAPTKDRKFIKLSKRKMDLIRTLDLLVIDEISMVRADLLDQVDDALRKHRNSRKPFGGVQLLLIGDLMQLSPVTKQGEWSLLEHIYPTPYFFSSRALKDTKYVTVELMHIYRQQNQRFIDLLAKVRNGIVSKEDLDALNARYIPGFRNENGEDDWIRLTTHNATAQRYNDTQLAALTTQPYEYRAFVKGDFPESSYPTDETLVLKVGAQVMFVKNDPDLGHRYFNGKIGKIVDIDAEKVTVSCNNGQEIIPVTPIDWDNVKYSIDSETKAVTEEIVGTFTQLPLRLAWAITVHKSQGLTFDHAVLDVNSSFAHGQTYVALSRCRSLEGLVLSSPITAGAIITDSTVNSYIDSQLKYAEENVKRLPSLKLEYFVSLLDEMFSFSSVTYNCKWLISVIRSHRDNYSDLYSSLEEALAKTEELNKIATKFHNQYRELLLKNDDLQNAALQERIASGCAYFQKQLHSIYDDIFLNKVSIMISNKETLELYKKALAALTKSVHDKEDLYNIYSEKEFTTHSYLNLKAKMTLGEETANAPKSFHRDRRNSEPKKPKRQKGDSARESFNLLCKGKPIEDIAAMRGLALSTVSGHIATFVENGTISVDDLVPKSHIIKVVEVIGNYSTAYSFSDVRSMIEDDISDAEIKYVIADAIRRRREQTAES